MNRKWMAAAGVAAILALILGAAVGRNVIGSPDEDEPPPPPPKPVAFKDPLTGVSLSYPASWTKLDPKDSAIRLLAAADPGTSLLVRVQKSGLEPVTVKKLDVVKPFTDRLLGANALARQLGPADPIELGGLPGWRYRYTYTETNGDVGGHIHYFLFQDGRIIQLVFQATPSSRLDTATPTFDEIARTFKAASQ